MFDLLTKSETHEPHSYYVLRDEMLVYYVDDISERLATRQETDGWQVSWLEVYIFVFTVRLQEVEASLHCILSVQEAVDMEKSPQLQRLFSPEIFGRFPSTGRSRIRRTALSVIGTPLFRSVWTRMKIPSLGAYSSWFATQSSNSPSSANESNLLLTVLSYVVSALPDSSLCLTAATALRNLCEANRRALAVHIGAFGELHSGLNAIPVNFPLLFFIM